MIEMTLLYWVGSLLPGLPAKARKDEASWLTPYPTGLMESQHMDTWKCLRDLLLPSWVDDEQCVRH